MYDTYIAAILDSPVINWRQSIHESNIKFTFNFNSKLMTSSSSPIA